MNPLAHNPFELADRAGLWVSSKTIKYAYRNFSFHPVAARETPRWLFIGAIMMATWFDPVRMRSALVFWVIYILVSILRLFRDIPAIRTTWNADLYRTYGAYALKQRESLGLRAFLLVLTVFLLALPVQGTAPETSNIPYVLSAVQLLAFMFSSWFEAAELPEPDDGDFFAKPQAN